MAGNALDGKEANRGEDNLATQRHQTSKEAGPQNAAAKPRHNGGEAAVAAAQRPLGREGSRVSVWGVPEARRWRDRAERGSQIVSHRRTAPVSEKHDAARQGAASEGSRQPRHAGGGSDRREAHIRH